MLLRRHYYCHRQLLRRTRLGETGRPVTSELHRKYTGPGPEPDLELEPESGLDLDLDLDPDLDLDLDLTSPSSPRVVPRQSAPRPPPTLCPPKAALTGD